MDNYGQFGGQTPSQPSPPPPMPFYYPPDYVSPEEKRKIRRNYNSIGITLLALYILIFGACAVSYAIYESLGHPATYNDEGMMVVDFWETFIGEGFPAISAIIVFICYCIFAKYNPKELFSTQRVNGGEVFKYVLIVLFFQQVSLICSMLIMSFLNSYGLEVRGLNYVIVHDPKVYAIDIFSAVILAPIGEELIYRGVVLRCAAKVSRRFAIFFSALIFGLMHGNPYQMVLGFLLGIPLGIITIKTGSIIPAIICHMANNFIASVTTVIDYYDESLSSVVSIIFIPVFFIIGIIVLMTMVLKGDMKLPEYTEHHRKRTLPIMITSWSMIVIVIFYIIDIIGSIGRIKDVPPHDAVTEAIKVFLK